MTDNRILKASFRECLVEHRKQFSTSTCIVPISVGQSIHEGKKFLAAMKLIEQSFHACTILVDDTVQRHTMAIDRAANAEELYDLSFKEGALWLERNQAGYKNLRIPCNIMRWDDWLTSDSFKESHLLVTKCYKENREYRNAIDANILSFLTRYFDRLGHNSSIDRERANALCLDYLLEECAVMCLWTKNKYDFEVYPSGRNQAMAATYEHLIKPRYPNLLRAVALRFKKYPCITTVNPEVVPNWPVFNFSEDEIRINRPHS